MTRCGWWVSMGLGVLCGCGGHLPPPVASTPGSQTSASPVFVYTLSPTVADEHRASLDALIRETRRIVKTPAFRQNLSRFRDCDVIKPTPAGWSVNGETVASHYLGESGPGRPDSVVVFDDGKGGADNPGSTGFSDEKKTHVDMHLAPIVLERWNATSKPYARACAINTVAHEWTHAIVARTASDDPEQIYRDGWYQSMAIMPGKHLVSYTVGAVAQCTWLQERGETDFDACVHRVGTRYLSADACEPPPSAPK